MTKTIRVSLTDEEHKELSALADREKRTLNAQAAYILHDAIPALKIRRAADAPETEPLGTTKP